MFQNMVPPRSFFETSRIFRFRYRGLFNRTLISSTTKYTSSRPRKKYKFSGIAVIVADGYECGYYNARAHTIYPRVWVYASYRSCFLTEKDVFEDGKKSSAENARQPPTRILFEYSIVLHASIPSITYYTTGVPLRIIISYSSSILYIGARSEYYKVLTDDGYTVSGFVYFMYILLYTSTCVCVCV